MVNFPTRFISLTIIVPLDALRCITLPTWPNNAEFPILLYTIIAPSTGLDQILYPVACAFAHRSFAFPHRVLCCFLGSMNGKNSGEMRAAP